MCALVGCPVDCHREREDLLARSLWSTRDGVGKNPLDHGAIAHSR